MKQSFINKITLCNQCNLAFIIDQEGDDTTCDACLDVDYEDLIEEGVIDGNNTDYY